CVDLASPGGAAVTWEVRTTREPHTMSSIQATRIRKGMLINVEGGLYRVLDLYHITPGNKRGHVQCRLRDIRSNRLTDIKFRSEDDVEQARLDEREMQYLYKDGAF